MFDEKYCELRPADSENDVLFGLIVPNSETLPCFSCSCPFVLDIAFFALSASSAKLKSVLPRIGPAPGIVMMSMKCAPLMPPWFWAANWSMRGSRIDRIWDFGGSLPPVNPSTRIVAPGGAISFSTRSISSGSSGSASICSRVSTVLNAEPRGSIAALCLSRLTVTSSSSFWSWRVMVRRLSPARTRTSRTSAAWKPGNSARIGVPARLEVFEHRDAETRRLAFAPDRRERLVLPLEDDRRLGQNAGRLVHDRDRQPPSPRRGLRLRLRGGRCAENEETDDAADANPRSP